MDEQDARDLREEIEQTAREALGDVAELLAVETVSLPGAVVVSNLDRDEITLAAEYAPGVQAHWTAATDTGEPLHQGTLREVLAALHLWLIATTFAPSLGD